MKSAITIILAAILFSLFVLPLLRLIAEKADLKGSPSALKPKKVNFSWLGGLAIILSTYFTLFLHLDEFHDFKFILIGSSALFSVRFLDIFRIPNKVYNILMNIIAALFVIKSGYAIDNLHGFLNIHKLPKMISLIGSFILILAINFSFSNMYQKSRNAMSISLVSFLLLAAISFVSNQQAVMNVALGFVGGIMGFMAYNFRKSKNIFMGSAGVEFIGFAVVSLSMTFLRTLNYQAEEMVFASNLVFLGVIGILFLPVFDLIIYRKNQNNSLDEKENHNDVFRLIENLGLNSALTIVFSIILFGVLFSVSHFSAHKFGITIALLIGFMGFMAVFKFLKFNESLNQWDKQVSSMEQSKKRI